MNREQLEHALRAACRITGQHTILVVGSQSILGSYSEDELPDEATRSFEIDLAFFNDRDQQLANQLDGAAGFDSDFYQTFGFYIDGVDPTTATLPHGWWDRLVNYQNTNTGGALGQCLEPHDCVLSKLAAGREKDLDFAAALLKAGLVHADVLAERVSTMDIHPRVRRRMVDWIACFQR